MNKKWLEVFIWISGFLLSILIFILILVNRWPELRQIGLQARFGFTITAPVIFLAYFFVFRIKGRLGWSAGLMWTMGLFAFSLAGLWATGQSEANVISGLLPWSDANSFYMDAQRLMEGGLFNSMSAQRPLFPAFLSLILTISGNNLLLAVAILVGIIAISIYPLGREVLHSHGPAAAALVMMIMFFYYRRFGGTTMTENLGVPFSALGFALLWRGAGRKNVLPVLGGVLLFTLGFNARPGPFFVFAGLFFWGCWLLRGKFRLIWLPVFLLILTVALGFVFNILIFRQVAGPETEPFSKFSNAIYGVVVGSKHWTQVMEDHPELSSLPNNERTRQIYQLAIEEFRKNPMGFFSGALHEYQFFFGNNSSGWYSYIDSDNLTLRLLVRLFLYALCLLGIIRWFRRREDTYGALALVGFIGILLSVPFAPPSDATRLRLYASASPVLALLPMLGLTFILEKSNFRFAQLIYSEDDKPDPDLASGLGVFLVLALACAPFFGQGANHPFQPGKITCPVGQEAEYIRYNTGSAIHVIKESVFQLDWMPDFHQGRFRAQLHNSPAFAMVEELDQIDAPATLITGLELKSQKAMWLVANTDLMPSPPTVLGVCGKWSDNPDVKQWRVFYASSVQSIP